MGVASSGTGTILDLEGDRGGERGGERGAGEEDLAEEVRDEFSHSLHMYTIMGCICTWLFFGNVWDIHYTCLYICQLMQSCLGSSVGRASA